MRSTNLSACDEMVARLLLCLGCFDFLDMLITSSRVSIFSDVFKEFVSQGLGSCLMCNQGACLNTEACQLCQSITDRRHIQKLLQGMGRFDLGDANTHRWNMKTDRDVRVGAGGL